MNAFFSFVGGFITAENNRIEYVRQSMAKLTFNGGGLFIDNKIENCVKLNECIMPSHYFFSGNDNFPNVTNGRSKIGDSIVYEEPIQIDDQLCLKCHENKRNNYILKCGHKVLCNECAEKMKSYDRCPLCNNSFIKIVAEKDLTDEKKCIIFFENEIDCIISPCWHLCACESCLKKIGFHLRNLSQFVGMKIAHTQLFLTINKKFKL